MSVVNCVSKRLVSYSPNVGHFNVKSVVGRGLVIQFGVQNGITPTTEVVVSEMKTVFSFLLRLKEVGLTIVVLFFIVQCVKFMTFSFRNLHFQFRRTNVKCISLLRIISEHMKCLSTHIVIIYDKCRRVRFALEETVAWDHSW